MLHLPLHFFSEMPDNSSLSSSSDRASRKVFFRHMNGHRAVCDCRDYLAQRLCSHIAHSENPGDGGFRGFIRDNIAAAVDLSLVSYQISGGFSAYADENAVTFDGAFRSGYHVP